MSVIHNTAMIAYVHATAWAGRKYDAEVTAELNRSKQAKPDASRVNKLLVGKNLLIPVTRVIGKLRAAFYRRSLPWSEDGGRLMPAAMYPEFLSIYNKAQDDLEQELDIFIDAYRNEVKQAARRMGAMFKLEDYPSPSDVRSRFSMKFYVRPVPSDGGFRVSLTDDLQEAIKQNLREDIANLTDSAMRSLWKQVGELIETVRDRLSDPEARFRRGLLDNLIEIVTNLDKLNVTNDPHLRQLRHDAMSVIEPLRDPEVIRNDMVQRAASAKELKALADQYSSLWS